MNTRIFVLKARASLGMTAEQFSELLDCAPRSVYRWEAGTSTPSGDVVLSILKLCKDKEIEINDFLFFMTNVSC